MNYAPTLTAEEFRTVHNALCSLDSICGQMEGVINSELFAKLTAARDTIRDGLQGAYKQESNDFDAKAAKYAAAKEEWKLSAIWSIYSVDDLTKPHPYTGARSVVYKDHWGDTKSVVRIPGNRWIDLYRAADTAINESGDGHHIFIEDFIPGSTVDGAPALNLRTGS